ncbi:3-phosphoshikimate 1-carboxyvinyltransferase [Candidatus Marinamargulisbacteria bacterium SCGC AG-333-B06]|nr:3-phosphoshikimate 1-carboxyvinyltransferase [Candidatus Marinamargulisbacteria bacterium SCGC AG-333-B06]
MSFKFKPLISQKTIHIHSIPGDKSISHRAIIIASLADNKSQFTGFLFSEDCLNTLHIFQDLGVSISIDTHTKLVTVYGAGLTGLKAANTSLDVGNSGTGIRLITGILAMQHFESTISGDHSILKRPMKRIVDPLRSMGAIISGTESDDIYPPLTMSASQHVTPISYLLPMASAQVKSCLLFAGLFLKGTTTITQPAICRDHTEIMLTAYQAKLKTEHNQISIVGSTPLHNPFSQPITIPADFSSASFFIVLGLIHPKITITLSKIGINPTRSKLLDVLIAMGADITLSNQIMEIEPYADITVRSSSLTNITVDESLIPIIIDEIPILAVAAMFASGTMTISGAKELRYKESDRIKQIVGLVNAFQGSITESADGFSLTGGLSPTNPVIDTAFDHRIAMSAIIASLAAGCSIELDSIDSIQTSFPNFFEIIETLN